MCINYLIHIYAYTHAYIHLWMCVSIPQWLAPCGSNDCSLLTREMKAALKAVVLNRSCNSSSVDGKSKANRGHSWGRYVCIDNLVRRGGGRYQKRGCLQACRNWSSLTLPLTSLSAASGYVLILQAEQVCP